MGLDDVALLVRDCSGRCHDRRNKNHGGLVHDCAQRLLLLLLLNRHEPLELKLLLLLKQLLLLQKLLLLKLLLLLLDLHRGKQLLLLLLKLMLLLLLPLLLKLDLKLELLLLLLLLLLLHNSGGRDKLALSKLKQGIADPLEFIDLDIQFKLRGEEKLELELV